MSGNGDRVNECLEKISRCIQEIKSNVIQLEQGTCRRIGTEKVKKKIKSLKDLQHKTKDFKISYWAMKTHGWFLSRDCQDHNLLLEILICSRVQDGMEEGPPEDE